MQKNHRRPRMQLRRTLGLVPGLRCASFEASAALDMELGSGADDVASVGQREGWAGTQEPRHLAPCSAFLAIVCDMQGSDYEVRPPLIPQTGTSNPGSSTFVVESGP